MLFSRCLCLLPSQRGPGGCRCLPPASVLVQGGADQGGVGSGIFQPGLQTSCPEWHRARKMQLLDHHISGAVHGKGMEVGTGAKRVGCARWRGEAGEGEGQALLCRPSAVLALHDGHGTCSLPTTGLLLRELCRLPDVHQSGHSSRPWAGLLGLATEPEKQEAEVEYTAPLGELMGVTWTVRSPVVSVSL